LYFRDVGVMMKIRPKKRGRAKNKCKALLRFFLRIFSSITCLKKLFSTSRIFCGGRYQPGYTGIF
jgi:hypothetical protein